MIRCIFHDIDAGHQDRCLFELVEDAYERREKVLIFVRSEERAASLDRTLWIMKQEAFIPHKIFGPHESSSQVPVGIVTVENNPMEARILIADAHCGLDFACGFDTVHEFVNRSSPEIQEACRERFRFYRTRKIPVEHLKTS